MEGTGSSCQFLFGNYSWINGRSFRHELYNPVCAIVTSYFVVCGSIFYRLIFIFFAADKEREVSKLKAQVQLEESWYITPPPCFEASGLSPEGLESSPMEDLLIEHPSMSVYGPGVRRQSPSVSSASRSSSAPTSAERTQVERREPRRTVQFQAQLELIEKRRQTEPPLQGSIRANGKNLKKQNMVHFQNNSRSKRNKKRNRMVGKHVGMQGKRACWPQLQNYFNPRAKRRERISIGDLGQCKYWKVSYLNYCVGFCLC